MILGAALSYLCLARFCPWPFAFFALLSWIEMDGFFVCCGRGRNGFLEYTEQYWNLPKSWIQRDVIWKVWFFSRNINNWKLCRSNLFYFGPFSLILGIYIFLEYLEWHVWIYKQSFKEELMDITLWKPIHTICLWYLYICLLSSLLCIWQL